ncbi:unnamed protein product, partial [Meganyctiphanes norvegica]
KNNNNNNHNNNNNNNNSNNNSYIYIHNIDNNNNKISNSNKHENNYSIINNITVNRNISKLPLIIRNTLSDMNVFKNKQVTPNIDPDQNLSKDKYSQTDSQLVNTWAKMRRRSAIKSSSDSLVTRMGPHTGDGVRTTDMVINVRQLEEQRNVAATLRQQFNFFKDYLATTIIKGPSETDAQDKGAEHIFMEKPKIIRK